MVGTTNSREHAKDLACRVGEKIDLMLKRGISESLANEINDLLSQLKSVLKNGKFCK